ncbi:MAG: hypothetical protein Q4C87_12670, partial [Actinomycetaceae bacterium]|nr:hypothetical protein [Actinomycetaceae bacterium]
MESPHWEVTVVEGGATVNGVPIEMTVPNVYSSLFAHLAGVARLVGHPVLARGIDHTQGDAESWFTVDARGNAEAAEPPLATRPPSRNRARLSRSDQERGRGSSSSAPSSVSSRSGSVGARGSASGSGSGSATGAQGPTIARRSALGRNETPAAGRHGAPTGGSDSAATALLTPL